MAGETHIEIEDGLRIPLSELTYRATRSGGPGGQHANTTSTRVELTWNVRESGALTEEQRSRLLQRLDNRVDTSGVLRLTASGSRSQARNRQEVTERFREIVAQAMRRPKPRKRTRPPRRAKERRLKEKKRRSELKKKRGPVKEE